MKHIVTAIAVASLCLGLTGCGKKKETQTIIATKPVKKKPQAPIRMQEYKQEADFKLVGSQLHCLVQRTPADSLAKVKDENGQQYVDNQVQLVITRADGSTFFKRTFTKASFDDCLNDDYRRRGILEGFVFDRVEGNSALFAASVSHPQSDDEYIPIVVTLTSTGNLSIARDTQMDTSGSEEEEEE